MQFTWSKFKRADSAKTINSLVEIDLPLLGIQGLTAKVDTGAFSGALHATKIREVLDKQGRKLLRFAPLGSPDHTIEVSIYHQREVKSSNGMVSQRFAIDTEIVVQQQTYPITITLTDRKTMTYPMLIGRNFLRMHGFLVDVR